MQFQCLIFVFKKKKNNLVESQWTVCINYTSDRTQTEGNVKAECKHQPLTDDHSYIPTFYKLENTKISASTYYCLTRFIDCCKTLKAKLEIKVSNEHTYMTRTETNIFQERKNIFFYYREKQFDGTFKGISGGFLGQLKGPTLCKIHSTCVF